MSFQELPPRYNSRESEAKWYPLWEREGYFRPRSDQKKSTAHSPQSAENQKATSVDRRPSTVDSPYVIVIPPPNVTGILHMGHALNNAIQDILVRWNRMKGRDTLWIPGVDHAGIATQNVVEKKLAKEKKTRHDLGREKFLEEVWKWKESHGSTITGQLRRLGASCDWTRERFTMDEGLTQAVREAFVTLYDRGLIYQGDYIINWCPRCQTALSDEEAEHKDLQGGLYHIKYPIVRTSDEVSQKDTIVPTSEEFGIDHIVVATTRPETMLGDTAVAVNPNDERYKHLIGKKVLLPLMNREIPVIADELVDPEFGTGIVKVTPAHDPNDFEMGRRHNLPSINILRPDGVLNENGGAYKGLDRFVARKKVIEDLEALGLFIRRDSHLHAVGHCYRCATVVEPYLSKQWFVKMKPLAEKALAAHREGKTKFYPDRWTKVYTNWLEGIRDWCISRQIWWGHQIPVWYCENCQSGIASSPPAPRNDVIASPEGAKAGAPAPALNQNPLTVPSPSDGAKQSRNVGIIVSRTTPVKCPTCGGTDLKQDPDVLDTWFSSWLWPFSTLGWPTKTDDLKHFYPTSDLITAPEIIFFWVARMIMAGLEFQGEVPFSRIYIHGTVRAQSGMKMSKSLGNAIDPIEVIDEMGADALRYSMVMLSAQDVYLSREKFEVGRNFTNKLWNAARFALMNLKDFDGSLSFPHALGGNPKAGSPTKDFGDDKKGRFPLKAFGDDKVLALHNRWILSRLEEITDEIEKMLAGFNLSQAATELYHFVWNDFCDWYIELAKPGFMAAEGPQKKETQKVLFFALEKILRLLHPFMPFITEEIWQTLREMAQDGKTWPRTISFAAWPFSETKTFRDPKAQHAIGILQQVVGGIRDLRVRLALAPANLLQVVVVTKDAEIQANLKAFEKEIKTLARLESLEVKTDFARSKSYLGNAFADFEVFIRIEGLVDPLKECERIQKKIAETQNWMEGIHKKLSNQNFVQSAPAEVVAKEREKLADAEKILLANRELLALFQ